MRGKAGTVSPSCAAPLFTRPKRGNGSCRLGTRARSLQIYLPLLVLLLLPPCSPTLLLPFPNPRSSSSCLGFLPPHLPRPRSFCQAGSSIFPLYFLTWRLFFIELEGVRSWCGWLGTEDPLFLSLPLMRSFIRVSDSAMDLFKNI